MFRKFDQLPVRRLAEGLAPNTTGTKVWRFSTGILCSPCFLGVEAVEADRVVLIGSSAAGLEDRVHPVAPFPSGWRRKDPIRLADGVQ
jgi:hypothetical protein